MIHVLIADDHALVRIGLKQLIHEQADIHVIGEATNGPEVLDLLRKVACNVLLLDISLPLRDGMEVLREVRRSTPDLPVLMLSVYPEAEFGIRVLKAGASGYICKATTLGDLVPAIRKVAKGGKYVSPTLGEHFAFELGSARTKAAHELLTDREYDVMRMMGAGKRSDDIAKELVLSVTSVSTYRARVLTKLRLKNNAELIRYVMQHNLAQQPVQV